MARHYALFDSSKFKDEIVVELGSGTGIVGLSILKYTKVGKIVFTDYDQ